MWGQTIVLADRIKPTLLAWTGGLIIAATASDQFDPSSASTLPLSILAVFAQTYIVTAALRVGLDPAAQAGAHTGGFHPLQIFSDPELMNWVGRSGTSASEPTKSAADRATTPSLVHRLRRAKRIVGS